MSNKLHESADLTAKPLTTISGHEDGIWRVAPLPGGKRVVTCSLDKAVRIWDMETGEQEGTSMEHESKVYGLTVTRDGKRILSGDGDKVIKVWDVETHELVEEWGTHTGGIFCIAISPDDQLAASGDLEGTIVIREMKEGGETKHSIDAGGRVFSVCFSPNGEKLACGVSMNADGRVYAIQIYDVESGKLVLGPIKAHEDDVRCVLWPLSDGSQLVSASDDRTIRFWNSETGELIEQPWTGHTSYVMSLSLSPDGTKLASASVDSTVCFWDLRSGDPIGQPLQHTDGLWALTFSPSGEFVASGEMRGKVWIWRVPWWDGSPKQAHDSFLDLPAVPLPKDRHQGEFDFLDLPTSRRPITSPPRDSTTVPTGTPVQRFWRGLVARRFSSSSSLQPISLQPIQDRRFWKSPNRTPLTEVAAGHARNPVVVARSAPRRRKKKDRKSRKPQKPQTHTGSSTAEAGPSSHAEPSGSASNAGPSNSQAGPSSSNAARIGRVSSFAQSTTGSDDSWDDLDGCEKCIDYLCFGPRENRERFRPWKKKSRAVMEAEEEAKKGKGRKTARGHPTSKAAESQNSAHPRRHHDRRHDVKAGSTPAPDDADPQHLVLQLQEQNMNLRRQLDDAVAAKEKAEAEMDGLQRNTEEFPYSGDASGQPPEAHLPAASPAGAGPSPSQAGSSGFQSNADVLPPKADPPLRPSSPMQSNLDSIEAVEQSKEEKRMATAEKQRRRHSN
ncbi:WD40 repeat-like protein [Paxillus ammoniavirescens]|nr:WD40 repeat-like protein [Paxillus ammoniavirescens]